MSKYIIDTDQFEKLFEIKAVAVLGIGDNPAVPEEGEKTVWTRMLNVADLEELNSDYINEHFGSLQDDAYKRGLEDGKKEAESSEVIEQAKVDAFNKGMLHKGEKIHDAYQRGLHEGNDIGYKDGFEDGKAVNDRGCEGCEYAGKVRTGPPCISCCNSYRNQWTAKDDKIEVGDEVNWLGDCFIVTRIFQPRNMKEQCDGIDDDGCVYSNVLINDLEKTGRHFDIEKILEDMKA